MVHPAALFMSARDIPFNCAMEVDAERVECAENTEQLIPAIKSVVSHHLANVLEETGWWGGLILIKSNELSLLNSAVTAK